MAASRFSPSSGDIGYYLAGDVAALAISLPVIARHAFFQVVLPFVFCTSLLLVVLFFTPFRDTFIMLQRSTHGPATIRTFTFVAAFANLLVAGYESIDTLSLRWYITGIIAIFALIVLVVDIRKVFPE